MSIEMFLGDNHLKAIRAIGKGGFGNVFLSCGAGGEFVCVKRINADTKEARGMVEDEIHMISRLDHPNIIQFLWSFEHAGTMNIVMEYAGTTTTIRDVINERRNKSYINPTTLMDYFIDIVMGLEYLRRKAIVHRDIKPENLLISSEGNVKIADFGMSIFHRPGKAYFGGTLRYMSPEGLNCQYMDFRSDIWSLGCVLYELCFGDHPLGDAEKKCDIQEQYTELFNPSFTVDCCLMQDGDLWGDLCECMLTYNIKNRIKVQEVLNHDNRISSHKCVQQYYREK